MLKDHLGNPAWAGPRRKDACPPTAQPGGVLTDEVKSDLYPALSFEGAANTPEITNQNATWEKATGQAFDVIASRTTNANLQNYAGTPPTLTNSLLVRSSTGKVGAAKMIKVMAGDKIHTTVQYYYPTAGTNPTGTGLNTLTAGLATAIANSLAPVAAIKGGASMLASGVGADPAAASFFTSQNNNSVSTRPKAYLNVLFFDACPPMYFLGGSSLNLMPAAATANKLAVPIPARYLWPSTPAQNLPAKVDIATFTSATRATTSCSLTI